MITDGEKVLKIGVVKQQLDVDFVKYVQLKRVVTGGCGVAIELNANGEETVWWQTTLHILMFPIVFLLLLFATGVFLMIFGDLNSWLSFGTRGFQSYLATHFGLMLPTFLLSKSNEVVASVVCGTLLAIYAILIILAIIFIPDVSLGGVRETLELAAQFIGMAVGTFVYYSGDR